MFLTTKRGKALLALRRRLEAIYSVVVIYHPAERPQWQGRTWRREAA